ncbi:MAG: PilZ domain-containing protein [Desulfobacterales bacterium]|nr:PilZ domain-containing protein [Desulfobacterales bacterium]
MVKQDGTKSDIERREYERIEFFTSVSVIIDVGDKKIDIKGGVKDLSLKGVFIITEKKAPVGSPCSVKIFLSGATDGVELRIKGVVARTESDGVGIIFDSIDIDSFTHLKNIMKYNSDNN